MILGCESTQARSSPDNNCFGTSADGPSWSVRLHRVWFVARVRLVDHLDSSEKNRFAAVNGAVANYLTRYSAFRSQAADCEIWSVALSGSSSWASFLGQFRETIG